MVFNPRTGGWLTGLQEKIAGVRWCIESVQGSLVLRRGEGVDYSDSIDRSDVSGLDAQLMKMVVDSVSGIRVERIRGCWVSDSLVKYDISFFYNGERVVVCDTSGK